MLWFLPLGLGVGGLLTQASLERRRAAQRDRHSRDWGLFLLLGWIPLIAWIASLFVEQY